MLEVKTTTWTYLQSDNRHETTRTTRKTKGKVDGCCGTGNDEDRRRWKRTIDDQCSDPDGRTSRRKRRRWRTTWDDGKEPSMTIAATPDDGTSLRKRRKWRTTGDDGKEPSMTIAATPDDGTSLRKRRRTNRQCKWYTIKLVNTSVIMHRKTVGIDAHLQMTGQVWGKEEDSGRQETMARNHRWPLQRPQMTRQDGGKEEDGGRQETMARNHRWPLRRPQMTGQVWGKEEDGGRQETMTTGDLHLKQS